MTNSIPQPNAAVSLAQDGPLETSDVLESPADSESAVRPLADQNLLSGGVGGPGERNLPPKGRKKTSFKKGHRPWNTRDTPGCGLPGHDEDHFDSWGKKSCRQCHLVRSRGYAKKRLERDKRAAIDAYGGYCSCCGEDRIVFLCIDHINEDGSVHRKKINARGSATIYRWLRKNDYPLGFQVLCHNCNFAKHWGGCPHQLGVLRLVGDV